MIFFALLNESYKLDAEEKLQLITIASIPHMEKSDASSVVNNYRMASRDIIEVIGDDNDYGNLDKLKKSLS